MNTYEEYYAHTTRLLQAENMQILNDPRTLSKVDSWAERSALPTSFARYEFHTNPAFRLMFLKDTKKQNAAEKALFHFLGDKLPTWQVIDLPKAGPQSLQLVGGLVIPTTASIVANAKTIDIKFVSPSGKIIYATHKRTTGTGGAQKNQCSDAEAFLREAERNAEPNVRFYALLDGDYYTPSILARVSQLVRPEKTFVCTSDEFVAFAQSEA